MFIAILEHEQFDDFDLSSLRTGIMAGVLAHVKLCNVLLIGCICLKLPFAMV